ncbi:hypothetical protein DPEC_G00084190 [Dallia pectoralis]|uniref:Uncharacterized protein n=1 Tax=Dallia pectoralis TaxID=75939 RepID=A0ACC2H0B4_DALPE|nr:hypothetical protein DPEC_G00084190 [Dallia pectoralis]
MSSLVLFLRQVVREVPGWFLWLGVFLPFTLLIIQIMVYLNWKLTEVETKLSAGPHAWYTTSRQSQRTSPSQRQRARGAKCP